MLLNSKATKEKVARRCRRDFDFPARRRATVASRADFIRRCENPAEEHRNRIDLPAVDRVAKSCCFRVVNRCHSEARRPRSRSSPVPRGAQRGAGPRERRTAMPRREPCIFYAPLRHRDPPLPNTGPSILLAHFQQSTVLRSLQKWVNGSLARLAKLVFRSFNVKSVKNNEIRLNGKLECPHS